MRRTPRGKDKSKRQKRSRLTACPYEIVSLQDHLDWHGDDGGFDTQRAPEVTDARSGSLEKLHVMRRRVERGEMLHTAEDSLSDLD